jgi:hypothetical protein
MLSWKGISGSLAITYDKETYLSSLQQFYLLHNEISPTMSSDVTLPLSKLPTNYQETKDALALSVTGDQITELLTSGITAVPVDSKSYIDVLAQVASSNIPLEITSEMLDSLFLARVRELNAYIYLNSLRPDFDHLLSVLEFRLNKLITLTIPDIEMNASLLRVLTVVTEAKQIDAEMGRTLLSLSKAYVHSYRSVSSCDMDHLFGVISESDLLTPWPQIYAAENAVGAYTLTEENGNTSWEYIDKLSSIDNLLSKMGVFSNGSCSNEIGGGLSNSEGLQQVTSTIPYVLGITDIEGVLQEGTNRLRERRIAQGFCSTDNSTLVESKDEKSDYVSNITSIIKENLLGENTVSSIAGKESFQKKQQLSSTLTYIKLLSQFRELNEATAQVLGESTEGEDPANTPSTANIYFSWDTTDLSEWNDIFVWYEP